MSSKLSTVHSFDLLHCTMIIVNLMHGRHVQANESWLACFDAAKAVDSLSSLVNVYVWKDTSYVKP